MIDQIRRCFGYAPRIVTEGNPCWTRGAYATTLVPERNPLEDTSRRSGNRADTHRSIRSGFARVVFELIPFLIR